MMPYGEALTQAINMKINAFKENNAAVNSTKKTSIVVGNQCEVIKG